MLDKELIQTIDKMIEDNQKNNIWETYELCKKTIQNINWKEYLEYISYITEKLKI